jgi:16S rRNA processing protein RimM
MINIPDNYLEIGRIVNTHGLKGDLRVMPSTDSIKRFELLNSIEVILNAQIISLEIERVWYHKHFVMLKFKGIDDATSAERYKTATIIIPKSLALPLEDDEYYIGDLVSMKVHEACGNELGTIIDVLFTGANDVYVVKNDEGKQILIPALKQCILKVDVANKLMIVKLLEGLKDL